jgi:hypothetical protein
MGKIFYYPVEKLSSVGKYTTLHAMSERVQNKDKHQ